MSTPHEHAPTEPHNPAAYPPSHCSVCSGHVDIVGTLRADGECIDMCEYCARGFEQGDAIERELVELLRPWYATRRNVSRHDLGDLFQAAVATLDNERAEEN